MRPLWTQPLHTSASIPLDYASKGYVDGVLAIPDTIFVQKVRKNIDKRNFSACSKNVPTASDTQGSLASLH